MFTHIVKRDGRVELFDEIKITKAIRNAFTACEYDSEYNASRLTMMVVEKAEEKYKDSTPEVEGVQDIVEQVLIENGYASVAKAYILYRQKRK